MPRFATVISAAVLAAGALLAADRPFQDIMKAAVAANGNTRKALTDKDNTKAAMESARLKAEFKAMAKYWAKHGKADAAGWSKTASVQADMVGKAIKKGNAAKADEALKAVGATCRPCHEAYREKGPDGRFLNKMKG